MQTPEQELERVELKTLADALNMAAICLAYASVAPLGSEAYKHYIGQINRYVGDIVTHINELGVMAGLIDTDSPAHKFAVDAQRMIDAIQRKGRADKNN